MFWPKGRWLSVRHRLRCRAPFDQIIHWLICASTSSCRLRSLGKGGSAAFAEEAASCDRDGALEGPIDPTGARPALGQNTSHHESLVMTSIKHPTAIPRVIEASYFREALISRPMRNRLTCEYEKGKAVSQPKRKAL